MLSSSVSVLVFETKVAVSASRVSATRRGLGIRGSHGALYSLAGQEIRLLRDA